MPRKVAFSGKQKKKQLKEKKQRKADGPNYLADLSDDEEENETTEPQPRDTVGEPPSSEAQEAIGKEEVATRLKVMKINQQPQRSSDAKLDINSFRLHFFKESDEAVKRKKKDAQKTIKPVDESCLEYKLEAVYPSCAKLNFPQRQPWTHGLTKEELEGQERAYFTSYVQAMVDQPRAQELSYFELNLDTWRQLWRVLEMSDVLLVIADVRYPILHIPPNLVSHIRSELDKHVIIVLNKVDFVPASLALAWKRYIQAKYPGIPVIFFSSFPAHSLDARHLPLSHKLYKRPFQGSCVPIGPEAIYLSCRTIVKERVDLSSWKHHLEENQSPCDKSVISHQSVQPQEASSNSDTPSDSMHQSQAQSEHYRDGVLTIGCIGYPNVGKSSVINALLNRKAVSVSQTPGHTKHFQTHFLCPAVKLCDCPGLVFPSMVSKSLQVIAGIFPVAQVREPYSVVAYLARRLNLPLLLNLTPPNPSPKKTDRLSGEYAWSALDICEAFATKQGYFTAKAGRPDAYRGANKILRLAVEGQICLSFRPVGYTDSLVMLEADPERETLDKLFASHSKTTHKASLADDSNTDSGGEGEDLCVGDVSSDSEGTH